MRIRSSSISKIKLYFENTYSSKKNIIGIQLYGVKEDERVSIVKKVIGNCDGLSVLDIGCGNGQVLKKSLTGFPALICLEDLVMKNSLDAKRLFSDCAEHIEATEVSGFDSGNIKYDKVIMLGVTDYYKNWNSILHKVIKRSNEILLVDFPKSNNLRVVLRKIWLGIHGLSLRSVTKNQLVDFLDENIGKYSYTIEEVTYNWLVIINLKNKRK